jgi:YD repeat-containing protein
VNYSYNPENKLTGWQWADAKARTIAYDTAGQSSAYSLGDPMGAGSAAGVLRSVNRDAAGRITGYSHVNNGGEGAAIQCASAAGNCRTIRHRA